MASSDPAAKHESKSARGILAASSALGISTLLDRGLGFTAHFIAARMAGAEIFGAYSLAMTTANSIAAYAGSGIGSTATRFSGGVDRGSGEHNDLVRALAMVAGGSALLASLLLAAGAGFLANVLLHNPGMAGLLRWSALSAAGIILLECLRGLLIGQRDYRRLLLLSGLTGAGMVVGLPLASQSGPQAMIIVQGACAIAAFLFCGSLVAKGLPQGGSTETTFVKTALQVWKFGGVQFLGIAGLNAAGWWVASRIALGDPSFAQVGYFAVSNQLRNVASLAPGMLTQSSYGLLAHRGGDGGGDGGEDGRDGHERVLSFCTFAAAVASISIVGLLVAMLPWAIPMAYGESFKAAIVPACLALATAILHMSAAPASARLSIVSLRDIGMINAVWAVLVSGLAYWQVGANGAASAAAIYFAGHLCSILLTLWILGRLERLPDGLILATWIYTAAAFALSGIAIGRVQFPGNDGWCAIAALVVSGGAVLLLLRIAFRNRWISKPSQWKWPIRSPR